MVLARLACARGFDRPQPESPAAVIRTKVRLFSIALFYTPGRCCNPLISQSDTILPMDRYPTDLVDENGLGPIGVSKIPWYRFVRASTYPTVRATAVPAKRSTK